MRYIVVKRYGTCLEKWKATNRKYLFEVEKFLDKASLITDAELQESIIIQMLRCDRALTELSEKMFRRCYLNGYKKAKSSIKL